MVSYLTVVRQLAVRSRTQNRKRSGDFLARCVWQKGFCLDDAGQHQDDDKRQRHSQQPEKDGHVWLLVHEAN